MRLITGFLIFFLATAGHAATPEEIYKENFISFESGIYNKDGSTFFVVKQPCTSIKKYSGTAESKLAEQAFYQLLAYEVISRNLIVPDSIVSFDGELKQNVLNKVKQNFTTKHKVSHQLILDQDNGQCARKYVRVTATAALNGEKVTVTRRQIDMATKQLFLEALESPYRLNRYLTDLGITDLAAIYAKKNNSTLLVPDFTNPASISLRRYSAYDFNFTLAAVFATEGMQRIQAKRPNPKLAEEFYNKAKSNFNLGKNPDQIIKDLTISVNASPEKVDGWIMLSSTYRAISAPKSALYASQQAILQNPNEIEMWVYWLKAKTQLDKAQADKLHSLLLLIGDNSNLTSWALKQLKAYK